ncbi:MAG: patatin-like phospholipase family protein [Rickettsiaceae bacterium H1]|nr:patatin-like phospholipase family protein [Rickettsiaceae bacterium H1]
MSIKSCFILFLLFILLSNKSNTEQYNTTFHENTNDKKPIFIIAIDGGGLRGMIPALIISDMEKKFSKAAGKEIKLMEVFDAAVGTSTGGLITLMTNVPRPDKSQPLFSSNEIVEMYKQLGKEVFQTNFWESLIRLFGLFGQAKYNHANLEKYLKKYLGNNNFLSNTFKPIVITTYDNNNKTIFPMASYRAKESKWLDFPLWLAGRATSAAPSYFEPVHYTLPTGAELQLIDGGIGMNNPGIIALDEAMRLCRKKTKTKCYINIVSIGTGTNIAKGSSSSFFGIFGVIKPTIEGLFNAQNQITEDHLKFFRLYNGPKSKYFRLNTYLSKEDSAMDDPTKIPSYEKIAKEIIESPQYLKMIKYLIDNALKLY